MSIEQLSRDVERTYGVYHARNHRVSELEIEVKGMEDDAAVLGLTEAALSTLLSEVSQENLKQIEGLVSYGLQAVFDDKALGFKFVASQQRGGPALEPVLVEGGKEMPILDAKGGGPATVVSFLLRVIVANKLGLYKFLLLDESFAMVSRQYVPNVAKLLKELAAQLNTTFLLVTHQDEFLDHADRGYRVVDDPAGGSTFEEVQP